MPLTLQVDAGCLHCHASGRGAITAGCANHFAAAPFASGGITCVSCHGDASACAGMNLAITECAAGEAGAALRTLDVVLVFSPDDGQAREMAGGDSGGFAEVWGVKLIYRFSN